MKTVTVSSPHGVDVGEYICLYGLPERRWYVRLWYFLTFRKCPTRTQWVTVTSVEEATFTVREK